MSSIKSVSELKVCRTMSDLESLDKFKTWRSNYPMRGSSCTNSGRWQKKELRRIIVHIVSLASMSPRSRTAKRGDQNLSSSKIFRESAQACEKLGLEYLSLHTLTTCKRSVNQTQMLKCQSYPVSMSPMRFWANIGQPFMQHCLCYIGRLSSSNTRLFTGKVRFDLSIGHGELSSLPCWDVGRFTVSARMVNAFSTHPKV